MRFRAAAVVLVVACLLAPKASADAPRAADAVALDRAKDLFRQGVVLFNVGDYERALDLFDRSRAAFASVKNTLDAAICLDRLGRFDQALELYEDTLAKFGGELDASDRAAVTSAIATLGPRVASLEVTANVEARVLVDGRPRGELPLHAPLRVLPGRHVVRALKDGYATAESTFDVGPKGVARLDLALAPLAAAGQLRVEDPTLPGAAVFVDGVKLGETPWEGTLGPGRHVVWTRLADRGSAPTTAVVVQGQTAIIRLVDRNLGPTTRLDADPPSADLTIDGTDVGKGRWEGRLPLGVHRAVASEIGYHDNVASLDQRDASTRERSARLRLLVDPRHPRWPKAALGTFYGEVWTGIALGRSENGDPESSCPGHCNGTPAVIGSISGVRVGYRLPQGLGFEVGVGYAYLTASFERTLASPAVPLVKRAATFELRDGTTLQGPFVLAGASDEQRLGRFYLRQRLAAGLFIDAARDLIQGDIASGNSRAPVVADVDGNVGRGAAPIVMPEIGGGVRIRSFTVGGEVAAMFVLGDGPTLANGSIRPSGQCDPRLPLTCARASNVVASERAFRSFGVLLPGITFGASL